MSGGEGVAQILQLGKRQEELLGGKHGWFWLERVCKYVEIAMGSNGNGVYVGLQAPGFGSIGCRGPLSSTMLVPRCFA